MLQEKSMIQTAYEIIKKRKKPIAFIRLWEEIVKSNKLDENQAKNLIASFYTDLNIDGRFFNTRNNEWDLCERNLYDKAHVDIDIGEDEIEKGDEDSGEEKDQDEELDEEDEEFDREDSFDDTDY